MAKKRRNVKPGLPEVQSQSNDSTGINPKRDGTRAKGLAAVGVIKGQGTQGFRKRRSAGE